MAHGRSSATEDLLQQADAVIFLGFRDSGTGFRSQLSYRDMQGVGYSIGIYIPDTGKSNAKNGR